MHHGFYKINGVPIWYDFVNMKETLNVRIPEKFEIHETSDEKCILLMKQNKQAQNVTRSNNILIKLNAVQ